jgi:hypothetical protein
MMDGGWPICCGTPLTFLDIALASRHVLGVLGIDQKHFQAMLFENLKHGH